MTVSVGRTATRLEDLRDARIRAGFAAAAKQVEAALDSVQCATHGRGPTDVRLHFDKNGAADIKYDSCCEALTALISKALG